MVGSLRAIKETKNENYRIFGYIIVIIKLTYIRESAGRSFAKLF